MTKYSSFRLSFICFSSGYSIVKAGHFSGMIVFPCNFLQVSKIIGLSSLKSITYPFCNFASFSEN
jgi:hypothetical protein